MRPHLEQDIHRPADMQRSAWIEREVLPHVHWLTSWLAARGQREPEDIVQECLVRLLQTKSVADVLNVRGYLKQTAHSVLADQARRRAIVAFVPLDDEASLVPSLEADAFAAAAARAELCRVERRFERLSPRKRRILVLRRLDGLTTRSTAKRLGLGTRTVENDLAAAMSELGTERERTCL